MTPVAATADIADRLAYGRSIAGLSQRALAEAAGIDKAEVGRYETRKNTPRPERIAELAQALGVNGRWLATGDGEPVGYAPEDLARIEAKLDRVLAILEGAPGTGKASALRDEIAAQALGER